MGRPVLQLGDQRAFAIFIRRVSHAQRPDVTASSKGSKPHSKIDRALVPAHSRFSHGFIRMQQLAPGVGRQAGKRAVQEYAMRLRIRFYGTGISSRGAFVEQRVNQVQAELAAMQAKLILHNAQPLLRLGPAFYCEARIDSKMQAWHASNPPVRRRCRRGRCKHPHHPPPPLPPLRIPPPPKTPPSFPPPPFHIPYVSP